MAQDGVTCTRVDLSRRGLESIPDDLLSKAGSIDSLDLSGNGRIQLGNINKFSNITKLSLVDCELYSFPAELLDLPKLEELHLSGNKLQRIPECLRKLTKLRTLSVSHCGLSELPDWITDLTALEELDLGYNRLQRIPACLRSLTQLRKLHLSNCILPELPDWMAELTALEELELGSNSFKEFPKCLTNLTQLRKLGLTDCNLSELPDGMAELTVLEELELYGNALQRIPKRLANLTQLRYLDISNCSLSGLPDGIAELTALEELALYRNALQRIPECFRSLTKLRILYLSWCSLSELPDEMAELTALEELHLSGNKLQRIPECLRKLTKLRTLSVSHCGLSELPDWITHLTALEFLNADSNVLQDFPGCVLQLPKLRGLDLSNEITSDKEDTRNSIKDLPVQLANNVVLETLELRGNPMRQPPVEICMQGFGAIKEYLKAIIPGGELMCADTINMLGDSGAGKTSIAQSLQSGQPCPAYVDDCTRVMQQLQAKFGDKLVHVNDFGGHEIYQAVLTVFLPSNGLVLLAYDMSKKRGSVQQQCMSADISNQQEGTSGGGSNQIRERKKTAESVETEVKRWLLTVLAKSDSVRVVVVGTHADEITRVNERERMENQMREHTENLLRNCANEINYHKSLLKGRDTIQCKNKIEQLGHSLTVVNKADVQVVTVSCKESYTAGGLGRLRSIVLEKLKGHDLPASWCLVIKDILQYNEGDASDLALLSWEQALAICKKRLLQEDVEQPLRVILRYLVSTSQIIWIEKHESLQKFVICRPQCIIEVCKKVLHHDAPSALKSVLDEDQEKRFRESYSEGCIPENCLRMLLSHTREGDDFESKFKFVMEFMEHFNLISKVYDNNFTISYVLPTLLPNDQPSPWETGGGPKLAIKIELSFVGSLIPQAFFETNFISVLRLVHSEWIKPFIWKDGVLFERDGVWLIMSRPTGKNILEISAYPDSEEQNMWPHLKIILKCINDNVMQSWQGAPPFCMVTCPGCRCCGGHDTTKTQRGCNDTTLEELATTIVPPRVFHYLCHDCHKKIPRSLCLPHFSGPVPIEDQRQVKAFFEDLRRNCSLVARKKTGLGGTTPALPEGPCMSQAAVSAQQAQGSGDKQLTRDGMALRSAVEEGFRKSFATLRMRLTESQVCSINALLFSKFCISTEEMESVQAERTPTDKAHQLLSIVQKKGHECITAFLRCLDDPKVLALGLRAKVEGKIEEARIRLG